MKKKIFLVVMISIILLASLTFAHENFTETKQLVDSNVNCNELSNEQVEEIGDYLMELMHPGEAHEQMHDMMGGEDSETTKLMHVNMAKMMYCNNGGEMDNMMSMMSGGMMNSGNMMDGGMMTGNMMSSGMMSGQTPQTSMMQGMMGNNMMGSGMTGNWQYSYGYWNFVNILYIALLIGLVILVYFLIIKLWRK